MKPLPVPSGAASFEAGCAIIEFSEAWFNAMVDRTSTELCKEYVTRAKI